MKKRSYSNVVFVWIQAICRDQYNVIQIPWADVDNQVIYACGHWATDLLAATKKPDIMAALFGLVKTILDKTQEHNVGKKEHSN